MSNPYRGLNESELVLADHYAETGNREGLRKMQELSQQRTTKQQTIIVHGNPSHNQDD